MHRTPSSSKGFQGAGSKKLPTARPLGTVKALGPTSTMLASSGVTSSHVHTFYSFFIAHKIHQDSSSVKGLFVDFVSPLCAASSHILPELMQLPIGRIPARVSPFCHAAYQGFCCPEIWNPIPWFTNGCHHTHRMAARWTKEKPLQKKQKTRHQTCTA